ncbi:Gfo/Idh/MocA family protein [Luteimonas sp. A478]
MTKVRWGMIGVGSVAKHKSGPAFQVAEGGELVGVASRRAAEAELFARAYDVPMAYSNPLELINSSEIDAIYVATPPSSHVNFALEVARAGKPCCIEKPMAVRYGDAQAALEAFDAASLPLFVSYYRRSLPRFKKVTEWLRSNKIGPVREVHWRLSRVSNAPINKTQWRMTMTEAPGGIFEDLACHGLDLFDYMLGPISAIESAHLESSHGTLIPDRVRATWHHGKDVIGTGDWNFAATQRIDSVTVVGTRGRIEFSMFDEMPVVLHGREGSASLMIENPNPIQLPHVEAMNTHLAGGSHHPSTAHSAIRTALATEVIVHRSSAELSGIRLAQESAATHAP